ncbi:hypothetical protein GCM10011609_75880 [Lentzea pudingi]|uniref:Uncharacterized protein n=1 Tax=Lentzea pudingi TaxID=1789439 RepID=A0ABQ2ITE9_9PSEU|nr:DUF6193 family natural product biosynthesis protein [Lentzea pudingi]GGN23248.1 hypothetical protein GCM10011609_75880 [Lentzea pudingi]
MGRSLCQHVVDAGGLEIVLREACPGGDIELETFPGALTATVTQGDRSVRVSLWRQQRQFRIRYVLRKASLAYLTTTDLAEFTGSVALWLGGATARELAAAWPSFADFVAVADAFENGDRLEFIWQMDRALGQHGLGEFIEAAMREPRLRRLYPFTSHWWMSFKVAPDAHRWDGPWVRALGDGRFSVTGVRYPDRVDVDYDAAEAVRVCVAELDRLGVPSPSPGSACP